MGTNQEKCGQLERCKYLMTAAWYSPRRTIRRKQPMTPLQKTRLCDRLYKRCTWKRHLWDMVLKIREVNVLAPTHLLVGKWTRRHLSQMCQ
jgi:hypothetical protein